MTVQKTTAYEMFNFREDNRAKIDPNHVQRLMKSIEARNLLELRPISVNGSMEVIDGQHRLLAAKNLGVAIYYQIEESLTHADIILMNIAKQWTSADYLNYYIKNGQQEYIKLAQFMKTNNISLKIAMSLTMPMSHKEQMRFKAGEYVFTPDTVIKELDTCWDTIRYIKKMNGYSAYTSSGRFWKALIKLVKHELFDSTRWSGNLERMIDRVGPRARVEDYLRLFMEIHNWRNNLKINLLKDENV